MRGRYYSPLWHRFVSSDRGADPNGPNQYAYVGGSPFTATDPSGMEGEGYYVVVNGVTYPTSDLKAFFAMMDGRYGEGGYTYALYDSAKRYLGGGGTFTVHGNDSYVDPWVGRGTPPGAGLGLGPGYGPDLGLGHGPGAGGGGGGPVGGPKRPSAPTAQKCGDGGGILDSLISAANTVWYGRSDEVALHSQTDPYAKVLYASSSVGLKETGISGGIATATAPLGGPGSPWVFRAVGTEASVGGGFGVNNQFGVPLPTIYAGGSIFKAQIGYQMTGGTLYFGLDVGAGLKSKSGVLGLSCIFGASFEK
jgi:hypothetical protein